MIPRTTLIALGTANVLLLIYFVIVEFRSGGAGVVDRRLLPALQTATVSRIVVRRGGTTTLELRRSGGRWRVVRPKKQLADAVSVQRLLAAAEHAELTRVFAPKQGPMIIGKPAFQLELHQGRAEPLIIAFGALDPSGKGVYVQVQDRRGVAPAELMRLMRLDAADYLSRDLVQATGRELSWVQWSGASGVAIRLERKDGQLWLWAPDGRKLAARTAGERALGYLASLQASRFGRPDTRGVEKVLSFGVGDKTGTLSVGGACEGYPSERTLSLQDVQGMRVNGCLADYQRLLKVFSREALLERRAFVFQVAALDRLKVSCNSTQWSLERDGPGWVVNEHGKRRKAPESSLHAYFAFLRSLKGAAETTEAGPGACSVEFGNKAGTRRVVIWMQGGRLYFQHAGASAGFRTELGSSALGRIVTALTPGTIKKAAPSSWVPEAIQEVAVLVEGRMRLRWLRKASGWHESGGHADKGAVERVLKLAGEGKPAKEEVFQQALWVLRLRSRRQDLMGNADEIRTIEIALDRRCHGQVQRKHSLVFERRLCEVLRRWTGPGRAATR